MNALVFQLYGPMLSWGDIAVGEERPSAAHPGRSALLGLLGAALGVERTDSAGQRALAAAVRFGVEVTAAGVPLWDFHTAQTATKPAIRRAPEGVRNRAELLALDEVKTILSKREYRCEAFYRVVTFARSEGAAPSLSRLREALCAPRFPLYLGRRSCPLALPLDARLVEADTLESALGAVKLEAPATGVLNGLRVGEPSYLWEEGVPTGMAPDRTFTRRDESIDRGQWLFTTRREHQHVGRPAGRS